jgi:MFS family permease
MFLGLPLSWVSVLVFAASLGFLWLGTVPLTSGLVGYMFGSTRMSMLWGIVFFSHQLGSFLGGWGAGRIYDLQGNYGLMWWISVGLGAFAAVIHWRIRERPVPRLANPQCRHEHYPHAHPTRPRCSARPEHARRADKPRRTVARRALSAAVVHRDRRLRALRRRLRAVGHQRRQHPFRYDGRALRLSTRHNDIMGS